MAEPATELNSLKRVSIVQQVEQVIADRIVDGTYAVDTKLPAEMTLSKQLGSGSRHRAGSIPLVGGKRGLWRSAPGAEPLWQVIRRRAQSRQCSGSEPTKWSFLDCVQVRNALEPLAARLMAERSQPEDLLELQHIHQKICRSSGKTGCCHHCKV